jgi:hypothetical protein
VEKNKKLMIVLGTITRQETLVISYVSRADVERRNLRTRSQKISVATETETNHQSIGERVGLVNRRTFDTAFKSKAKEIKEVYVRKDGKIWRRNYRNISE